MSSAQNPRSSQIQGFVDELSGFASQAERVLGVIEQDMEANKGKFEVFARMMLTIRGTSQQLGFNHVAEIARLGEEIAVKGTTAETRPQIRKCVGSLWDVLTTVKHLIVHHTEETGEEQKILVHRLEYTLNAFGGARPTFDQDEIEKLLKERG
jgi:chemotaxis protein histidine kinase CheA